MTEELSSNEITYDELTEELDEELTKVTEESEEPKEVIEEEEEEEDIIEERIYVVPLGKVWIGPRKKHSPRAVRMLRAFIIRHMKVEKDSIKITNAVNEKIWRKGIEKPPRKIKVRVTRNTEGIVTVRLLEGN